MKLKKIISYIQKLWQKPIIEKINELGEVIKLLQESNAHLIQKTDNLTNVTDRVNNIVSSSRDNIPELINTLSEARKSKLYKDAFSLKSPKVTVRIATYNKSKELIEVCLKSVLTQTYKNLEVIVIGDGCSDDTAERVASLGDPRIKFINLENRSTYPEDRRNMWYVAGSPSMNKATSIATGLWIAPLDDDDEFTPDHIEKLVSIAQSSKRELVYGALIQRRLDSGQEVKIYSDPPALNNFSFQSAIYPRALSFFQYDQQSWVVDEPGDWNLCRRMLLSGVTYSSTKDVVGFLNLLDLSNKKHYKD